MAAATPPAGLHRGKLPGCIKAWRVLSVLDSKRSFFRTRRSVGVGTAPPVARARRPVPCYLDLQLSLML